jgi:hypothetical protein
MFPTEADNPAIQKHIPCLSRGYDSSWNNQFCKSQTYPLLQQGICFQLKQTILQFKNISPASAGDTIPAGTINSVNRKPIPCISRGYVSN